MLSSFLCWIPLYLPLWMPLQPFPPLLLRLLPSLCPLLQNLPPPSFLFLVPLSLPLLLLLLLQPMW